VIHKNKYSLRNLAIFHVIQFKKYLQFEWFTTAVSSCLVNIIVHNCCEDGGRVVTKMLVKLPQATTDVQYKFILCNQKNFRSYMRSRMLLYALCIVLKFKLI